MDSRLLPDEDAVETAELMTEQVLMGTTAMRDGERTGATEERRRGARAAADCKSVEAGGVYTKNDTSQHTAMHGRMHGINSMRGHSSEDAVAIALPVVACSRRSLEQV
jgi:hypothetical protein